MSLAEIEAELPRLNAAELRRLAMSSWAAFVQKETADPDFNVCEEDDPALLAALDESVRVAEKTGPGVSADALRARLRQWTSR